MESYPAPPSPLKYPPLPPSQPLPRPTTSHLARPNPPPPQAHSRSPRSPPHVPRSPPLSSPLSEPSRSLLFHQLVLWSLWLLPRPPGSTATPWLLHLSIGTKSPALQSTLPSKTQSVVAQGSTINYNLGARWAYSKWELFFNSTISIIVKPCLLDWLRLTIKMSNFEEQFSRPEATDNH